MNLDEIIEEATGEKLDTMYSGDVEAMKQCMIIAVKQAIELAAERAKADMVWNGYDYYPETRKQSILSIIDEIEE